MVSATGALVLVLVDSLLRRVALPLVLTTAVIFRFNLFSFVYLLFLLLNDLIPGPRLKSQRASSLVALGALTVFSAVAALAQALFQISLTTAYSLESCKGSEPIWRQCGFIQFRGVAAENVIRSLLPDVGVFATSLVSLCFCAIVAAQHGKKKDEGQEEREREEEGEKEGERTRRRVSGSVSPDEELANLSSGVTLHPPFPRNVQCYLRLPNMFVYFFEAAIFFLLGLSGIVVPSLTSFTYYAAFLVILVLWSLQLRVQGPVRLLRAALMFYSGLHVLVLHLYQFQAFQSAVPVFANDSGVIANTTDSLLARLFGLTPIVFTDCAAPSKLSLWPDLDFTIFLHPFLLLSLFWLLANDLRLWIFTPDVLWSADGTYYLPVLDVKPVSGLVFVLRRSHRELTLLPGPSSEESRGSPPHESSEAIPTSGGANSGHAGVNDDGGSEGEEAEGEEGRKRRRRRMTARSVAMKVWQGVVALWNLAMSVNYTISIIVMMLWSVVYPSWPALVLLLWACAIWLVPRITPRLSLYYTSPLLVTYAIALLFLQYVHSLNLTESELPVVEGLGVECHGSTLAGCSSFVLLFKTAFATIFFASFHELVTIIRQKFQELRNHHQNVTDGSASPSPEPHFPVDVRTALSSSLAQLLSTYWVLVVVAAFLLVILSGSPNIFKAVYLVAFFLFLCVYQVSRGYWYKLCFLPWWGLVIYASLELVLVYTFQFSVVSDGWERACEETHLNVNCTELFISIGMEKAQISTFRSLFTSLIPPAIFIAVMAVQLRYFTPTRFVVADHQRSSLSALGMTSLLPAFVRNTLQEIKTMDGGETEAEAASDGSQPEGENGEEVLVLESLHTEPTSTRRSMHKQYSLNTTLSSTYPQSRLNEVYRFSVYLLIKIRQIIIDFVHLCWRFLELHMHKIAMLTLFAVSLSQISGVHWVLLLTLLLMVPMPYLNPLTYPVLTLYLGCIATAKLLFQIPLVSADEKLFGNGSCAEPVSNVTACGIIYSDSSRYDGAAWLGFEKRAEYERYIIGPIIAALLLSLWFSARRYQASRYKLERIRVKSHERGSLFLNVSREQADLSILAACKFMINHFYEIYGVEVSWTMLAITVAVRIDIYGVYYAVALGLLFLVPRRFLPPVWFLYLVLHGVLLVAQYGFLLGVPPGLCLGHGGNQSYPWDQLQCRQKKWLFLSNDVQLLDKTLLYADFIVYLLVCLQMYYFIPKKAHTPRHVEELSNFFEANRWLDYIKIFVFQYFFWISLFLLFFTAVSRVSVLGVIYLLFCFVFLYRGQEMLKDRRSFRHHSWALLRLATWLILLIRVTVQIIDCVYSDTVNSTDKRALILVFNSACTKSDYYGTPPPSEEGSPNNIGLWVDALNFAVITLQIIILDSSYSDTVRNELKRRESTAGHFAEIFDEKVEKRQKEAKEKRELELAELRTRAAELSMSERKIDHFLYAGVSVPSDIDVMPERYKAKKKGAKATPLSPTLESMLELSESVSVDDEPIPKPLDAGSDLGSISSEPELSRLAKTWKMVTSTVGELVDQLIDWLESTSALYREVTGEIKSMQVQMSGASPTHDSYDDSDEHTPLAEGRGHRYGTMETSPIAEQSSVTDEVGGRTRIKERHPSQDSQKKKVYAEIHHGEEEVSIEGEYVLMDDKEKGGEREEERGGLVLQEPPSSHGGGPAKQRSVLFDERGDEIFDALHLAPTEEDELGLREYEKELGERAQSYTQYIKRLALAIYYTALAHSEFLVYFLVFLNVLLNGSILSLVYPCLLFLWGILSIPWPSRKFWLTLVFYTMLVLLIKYGFQFWEIDWPGVPDSGLYLPRIIGVLFRKNFFANAAWDMLLLIALLFHRGLLKEAGLWKNSGTTTKNFVSSAVLQFWPDLKRFIQRLLNPEITQGAVDYYVPMLFFDLLCFVTIIFGFSSFGVGIQGQGVAEVAQFITTNFIPITFVILLLLQFLSMLIDRAIYLRRSLKLKVAYYLFLLVVWHAWLFFFLPSQLITDVPFTKNTAAQFIYFFKCIYFVISAMQVVAGYPTRVLRNILTSKYATIPWLAFSVYRVIPLLPVLREVADWVFTDTSLSLLHWFRVQEIYSRLFLVKVRREREKSSPRELGDPQSLVIKIFLGGLLLVLLVLLIWGPLLVISIINTTVQPNPPIEVNIQLRINGYQPLVVAEAQQNSMEMLSSSQYNTLRGRFSGSPVERVFADQFNINDFRRVVFQGQSTALWTISPPARAQLRDNLISARDGSSTVTLSFSWSITRAPSAGLATATVSGSTNQRLTNHTNTIDTLNGFINSLEPDGTKFNVSLPNLFPVLLLAKSSGAAENYSSLISFLQPPSFSNASCEIRLTNGSNVSSLSSEWWTLEQTPESHLINNSMKNRNIEIIVYSQGVAPAVFSAVEGFGIIGLYVSVVLVIGSFIRGYITDLPQQLIMDEIYNPDHVLKLCLDIFLVREQKNFKLEEILVGKLFFIFRSPERLVHLTEDVKVKQD